MIKSVRSDYIELTVPTEVLFNNSTMGLIRKNQHQSYGQRFIDRDFSNPDYSLLAKSFGIEFQHVETQEDRGPLAACVELTLQAAALY